MEKAIEKKEEELKKKVQSVKSLDDVDKIKEEAERIIGITCKKMRDIIRDANREARDIIEDEEYRKSHSKKDLIKDYMEYEIATITEDYPEFSVELEEWIKDEFSYMDDYDEDYGEEPGELNYLELIEEMDNGLEKGSLTQEQYDEFLDELLEKAEGGFCGMKWWEHEDYESECW